MAIFHSNKYLIAFALGMASASFRCAAAFSARPLPAVPDTLRVADCREMVPASFLLGKVDIANSPQLRQLAALINSTLSDSTLEMRYLRIGGMASPDGPEALNSRLAGERAEAVAGYLRRHTNLSASKIRTYNFGEAWSALRTAVNRRGYSFAPQVCALIDTVASADRREQELRLMDGGSVWRTLAAEVFPSLRCTAVEICRDSLALIYPVDEVQPQTVPSVDNMPDSVEVVVPEEPEPEPPLEPAEPKTRFFAAKTNALHLLLLAANAGFEVQVADRWSVDVPVWYSPYNMFSRRRKWRLLAVQPEARYWLGQSAGRGHFLGVHGHLAGFNVALKSTRRYQDPNHAAWGFGLGYGYACALGKKNRWFMDFNVGAGFVSYKYDEYKNFHNGPLLSSGSGTYWGVTRLGVSLSYRWYWETHKKQKGGRP